MLAVTSTNVCSLQVNQVGSSISALLFSMFSTIGIALLTGSFVVQPVIEQDTKVLHCVCPCDVRRVLCSCHSSIVGIVVSMYLLPSISRTEDGTILYSLFSVH